MAWVVDTCLLIDVLDDDPDFSESSAQMLDSHSTDGLVISPMTYVELSPAFKGNLSLQDEFLAEVGVSYQESWKWEDTLRASSAWHTHRVRRRQGQGQKRPLADILIGAFASRFQGLITRNPADFRSTFPSLVLRISTSQA